MISEHWQRVRDVFEAAKEMAPAERAAYLAETCHDDEWVRAEAQALLVAYEAAGDFIEEPAFAKVAGLSMEPHLTSAVGRRIGPYEIVREIGRGGMGVVYLAVRADDEYHRRVAIKLAWPGHESSEVLRRFRQERQILANLDHPNIARLLDGGSTEDGLPYVVMEYIAGSPITDYCDEHKLTVTERLTLFLTVCAAAAYAHRNLVIHRDLKPSNILVAADATPKLLDFGIAKLLTPDDQADLTALTGTGLRMMTPDYASPEQVRGQAITTVSDVYSLGVVLYELLTGHRPYRFKNRLLAEMERAISEQEPERPSVMINRVVTETTSDGAPRTQRTPESVSLPREGRPEKLRRRLAGDLDNVLLMALRKDVRQRYQSVEQLSADIRRHLEGRPVLARKATLVYRASKFIRRYKMSAAVAALVLLTLLGGIFATMRQASIARKETRDKRRLLYAAEMHMAAQAWEANNIARLRELVERQAPRDGEEDLRGFEWYYLWRRYHEIGESFTLHPDIQVLAVEISPNGKLAASDDDSGLLTLWNAATGEKLAALDATDGLLLAIPHSSAVSSAAFSPDGATLATGHLTGNVKLWHTASRQSLATVKAHTNTVSSLMFSPDGRVLATASCSYDKTAKLWDVATGQLILDLPKHEKPVCTVAFSADNLIVATGSHDGTARLCDVKTGRERLALKVPGRGIMSMAFSPDGTRLAIGAADGTVGLWDVKGGGLIAALAAETVLALAFSPDSRRLATGGPDGIVKLFDTSTHQEVIALSRSPIYRARADSRDTSTHQGVSTLPGFTSVIQSVAFSPDGNTLVSGSQDWTVRFWRAAAERDVAARGRE